jgi:hypothetical protein
LTVTFRWLLPSEALIREVRRVADGCLGREDELHVVITVLGRSVFISAELRTEARVRRWVAVGDDAQTALASALEDVLESRRTLRGRGWGDWAASHAELS